MSLPNLMPVMQLAEISMDPTTGSPTARRYPFSESNFSRVDEGGDSAKGLGIVVDEGVEKIERSVLETGHQNGTNMLHSMTEASCWLSALWRSEEPRLRRVFTNFWTHLVGRL